MPGRVSPSVLPQPAPMSAPEPCPVRARADHRSGAAISISLAMLSRHRLSSYRACELREAALPSRSVLTQMSYLIGSAVTRYGKHQGRGTLDLMGEAASEALTDAGLERRDIDAVICGYSTTLNHLMLATNFAEHFGLRPSYAHVVQLGGATAFAMVMLAHYLADAGVIRRALVVAGENRLTGHSRDSVVQTLAQVGHPDYEVPLGPTIPAYYALVASRYMHETGASEAELAELPVLLRRHAGLHPGAHFRGPVTVDDVMASRLIASPLKLLDCCPVSDGGAACVVSNEPHGTAVRIRGCAQLHSFQHISAAPSLREFGAGECARAALAQAGVRGDQIKYLGIYDSFSITLAVLLEELGLAPVGQAGAQAREGRFNYDGPLPLNTHGGLIGYGHCGVGGAMAHLVEAHRQMTHRAEGRQVRDAGLALLHGDGGVLSSHVSLVLEAL